MTPAHRKDLGGGIEHAGLTPPKAPVRAWQSKPWPMPTVTDQIAGVCAPAVKDFATVRNRSAHTTEDGQPRSQTVMTYSEPSPADLESVLEAALRSSNLPSSAACGYEWITWCRITVRSTALADLPTCSDSSRRSCRKQMACKRSGPCLARARRLSRRHRGCGTTAGNSEETDRPGSRYRCR